MELPGKTQIRAQFTLAGVHPKGAPPYPSGFPYITAVCASFMGNNKFLLLETMSHSYATQGRPPNQENHLAGWLPCLSEQHVTCTHIANFSHGGMSTLGSPRVVVTLLCQVLYAYVKCSKHLGGEQNFANQSYKQHCED